MGIDIAHVLVRGLEILLGGILVIVISVLQWSTVSRQAAILDTLSDTFGDCPLFTAARGYLHRQKAGQSIFGDGGYWLPVLTLVTIVTIYGFIVSFGLTAEIDQKNVLLGGIYVFTLPAQATARDILDYQAQTLVTVGIAYLTALIVVLARLVRRINTSDISQITYYFLALHMLAAVIMACVLRHILVALPNIPGAGDYPLALIGAVVGLRPDLGMAWIISEAARLSRGKFGRDGGETSSDTLPGDLGLENIEGLNYEKRTRLQELDIDNCQFLACQNPFMLWTRTSYGLSHIIDWIGQAKLHLLVKAEHMKALRGLGIRDIFSYHRFIGTEAGRAEITSALSLPSAAVEHHGEAIREDPAFPNLLDLRDRLKTSGCV